MSFPSILCCSRVPCCLAAFSLVIMDLKGALCLFLGDLLPSARLFSAKGDKFYIYLFQMNFFLPTTFLHVHCFSLSSPIFFFSNPLGMICCYILGRHSERALLDRPQMRRHGRDWLKDGGGQVIVGRLKKPKILTGEGSSCSRWRC
jgi:hypothetical protein